MNGLEQYLEDLVRRIVRDELAAATRPQHADLLSVAEFAARHSISPSTVRAMAKDGRLPAKRVGRLLRIPSDAVIGEPVRAHSAQATAIDRAKAILARGGR